MNKLELIKSAASRSGLSIKDMDAGLSAILGVLMEALEAGESVCLRGFGTFTVRGRKARLGYDMNAGRSVLIPATRVVKFKYSQSLTVVPKE